MVQKECQQAKTMLKELGTLVPKIEALKKSIDSGEDIEEIKKTKEELQDIIHKHRVLQRNLKEWERRSKDIQRIDKIVEKLEEKKEAPLSIDELHALYKQEVGGFRGSSPFSFQRDIYSETKGLRKKRQEEGKTKEDYARIYGCKPEQVTSEPDDVFRENSDTVVFIGKELGFTNKDLPETLKHVRGSLESESENAKLPKNLEYVGGNLDLGSLTSAKGLELPETVGKHVDLGSLTSAKGLVLPKTIGGYLDLNCLEEIPAEGLELPKTIGKYLFLDSLTSVKRLLLSGTIGGSVYLKNITKTEREELRKQRPDLNIIPNP